MADLPPAQRKGGRRIPADFMPKHTSILFDLEFLDNHPLKLTYLYQRFIFLAILRWFHPTVRVEGFFEKSVRDDHGHLQLKRLPSSNGKALVSGFAMAYS